MFGRFAYDRYLQALPVDWQIDPISEISTVVGGGTPSREVGQFWQGSIPWVTPGEVSSTASKNISRTRESISVSGLQGSGATLLPSGSLMITTRATLGARAINLVPMTTNQGFKSLVFKAPTDALFYYYLVDRLKPEFVRRASGTTFLEISGTEVGQIKVPVPPARERALIAEILDTLDTVIRQTEDVIEKLKLVKQGLLHDLLTRGIDANGELRPPQSQAPHLYKDSPLGWIPNNWDALQFSVLAQYTNGNTFDAGCWGSHGLPIIRIQNLNGSNSFNYFEGPVNSRWHVFPGDLLFAWSGQRGVSFGPRIWSGPEGVLNQHIFKVVEKKDVISKEFLFEILRFRQSVIEDSAHGFKDSFLHVTRGELGAVFAGIPSRDEQSMIVVRIAAFESRLREERASLAKNVALKTGLMDDLLIGRVRVTPLLDILGS